MKLIEKYAYRKLYKEAAAVKRRRVLPNPETLRKVCVLWQPSQEQAFKFLHDYFQRSQTIFRNFCVYSQETVGAAGTSMITPRDLNWMGLPKKGFSDDFIKTEYDLLMNIALEQNLVLLYLTALSRASFKIGRSTSGPNFFDLNIQIKGKKDALYLVKQQIHYLEQLNKKISV